MIKEDFKDVIVYSTETCGYCTKAKSLLKQAGIQFEEIVIGKHITKNDFFEQFPMVRTVPQIVINGNRIGGHDDLVKYIENYPEV